MEISTKVDIKPTTICNAFVGAFEGASNYWLHTADLVFATNKPDPKENLVWWGHENLYDAPFTFRATFDDPENDGEGEGTGDKLLSYPEDVLRGLELLAAKYPKMFADLASENDDAETHDTLMQCIVLGDVPYG